MPSKATDPWWKTQLTDWLKNHASDIESCIADAVKKWVEQNKGCNWFHHQLVECHQLTQQLSKGHSIPYDLPAIGPVYASWYLGRRINQALGVFLALGDEIRREKTITLADLGCGTVSCQIAAALLAAAGHEQGVTWPCWQIHNCDSSASMLYFGKHYLWPEIEAKFGPLESIQPSYWLGPWQEARIQAGGRRWVVASYLFDTDQDPVEAQGALQRLATELRPARIMLWTSGAKQHLLDQLHLEPEYHIESRPSTDPPLEGPIPKLHEIRKDWKFKSDGPTWDEPVRSLVIFCRNQEELHQLTEFYLYPVPARRFEGARLSPEQEKAARHTDRPTQIAGPAGCGKTLVLLRCLEDIVKKGANLVERPRVLFSTFNKGLTYYLNEQIENQFGPPTRDRHHDSVRYRFRIQEGAEVDLMHFDLLPTRLTDDLGKDQEKFLRSADETAETLSKIAESLGGNCTAGDFLAEEYHRNIFGLCCHSLEDYQSVERSRSSRHNTILRRSSDERAFIWDVIEQFEKENSNFTTRRRRLLQKINAGWSPPEGKYTHLIVDEAQDCTEGDYRIFYGLLSNPDHLIVAADLAQSIHLGKSASLPRAEETKSRSRQHNWQIHRLVHSFRVPYWTAKALLPLSKELEQGFGGAAMQLRPHKGAVPGTRVIFIWAAETKMLSAKVRECFEAYARMFRGLNVPEPHSGPKIQILEQDTELAGPLNENTNPPVALAGSVLSLKGLERRFVVWSLNKELPGLEKEEAAYTIATRSSNILVIACAGQPHEDYRNLGAWLDRACVVCWDAETEAKKKTVLQAKERMR